MRTVQTFRLIFLALIMASLLPACATATRGSTTLFIVETTPVGAKATTTVPTKEFGMMTKVRLNRIKSGKLEVPDFKYRFCEPTPCGIELPRRQNFHVLVTKDGFEPQVHEIGYMHRKEIKKETARNTALAAGVVGVTTGVAVGTAASSSILFTSSAAAGATAGALIAAPIILVGGLSMGVDAASGANYDVWPNPLPLTLEEQELSETDDTEFVLDEFGKMQYHNAMTVPLTPREAKLERKRLIRERREKERRQKKLEKDKEKSIETSS